MWMAVVMMCANIYANTCTVVTTVGTYFDTQEQCFEVSTQKANAAVSTPQVFYALPMCQEIVLGQEI